MSRRNAGFTLVELVVTLTVAAVLVALATPSFKEVIEKSRLRGATDDIVNLMNTARASAVKLGLDVNTSMIISADSKTWCGGAISAVDPEASSSTIGSAAATAAACDCTSATACVITGLANSTTTTAASSVARVSSDSYQDVKVSSADTNQLLNTKGGIVFNGRFGAMDLSSTLPSDVTVTSSTGRYVTRIRLTGLGQAQVCTTKGFVSGYPSC